MAKRKRQATTDARRPRRFRRDAQQRRTRLVSSALELFERHGYEVPLEQIAAHAGIGRATLYRNFGNRPALAAAVLEEGVQALLDALAQRQSQPDAFFWLLQKASVFGALHAPAVESAESDPVTCKRIVALRSRAYRRIQGSMQRAQVAGLLRKDFGRAEFWAVVRMLRAYAMTVPVQQRPRAVRSAVELVTRGIAPGH